MKATLSALHIETHPVCISILRFSTAFFFFGKKLVNIFSGYIFFSLMTDVFWKDFVSVIVHCSRTWIPHCRCRLLQLFQPPVCQLSLDTACFLLLRLWDKTFRSPTASATCSTVHQEPAPSLMPCDVMSYIYIC